MKAHTQQGQMVAIPSGCIRSTRRRVMDGDLIYLSAAARWMRAEENQVGEPVVTFALVATPVAPARREAPDITPDMFQGAYE